MDKLLKMVVLLIILLGLGGILALNVSAKAEGEEDVDREKIERKAKLEEIELPTTSNIKKNLTIAKDLYGQGEYDQAFVAFEKTGKMANMLANVIGIFNSQYSDEYYDAKRYDKPTKKWLDLWGKTEPEMNYYLSVRDECWYHMGLIYLREGKEKEALSEFMSVCEKELIESDLWKKAKAEIEKLLEIEGTF